MHTATVEKLKFYHTKAIASDITLELLFIFKAKATKPVLSFKCRREKELFNGTCALPILHLLFFPLFRKSLFLCCVAGFNPFATAYVIDYFGKHTPITWCNNRV